MLQSGCTCKYCHLKPCDLSSDWDISCGVQEKQGYLTELEELIPQMEALIQDKDALEQQVSAGRGRILEGLLAKGLFSCQ